VIEINRGQLVFDSVEGSSSSGAASSNTIATP
jgi:hypothetical protein